MGLFKFKSPFRGTGRPDQTKSEDSLVEKLSVNKEYVEAFRTKSYTDMLNKVESQLRRSKSHDRNTSSSSLLLRVHLSDYLEPRQETLIDMVKTSNLHPLLVDYFEASLVACNTCELLLGSVHQTRANYRTIKRVIKLGKRVHERTSTSTSYANYEQCREIFEELAFFAMLKNPLLVISSEKFDDMHSKHASLLDRLTVKSKKVRRRAKLARYCKKILGFSIVVSCNAILIALLVISIHSMVGIIAAPGFFACTLVRGGLIKTSSNGRLGSQLEVAAKVVFILINDFDTMSRLVRRLEDEIDHCKSIADICVRSGKIEVLMEVVRELWIHKSCFLEQLKELEEHIFLCFLTINRCRMLVMQELMVVQDEHE